MEDAAGGGIATNTTPPRGPVRVVAPSPSARNDIGEWFRAVRAIPQSDRAGAACGAGDTARIPGRDALFVGAILTVIAVFAISRDAVVDPFFSAVSCHGPPFPAECRCDFFVQALHEEPGDWRSQRSVAIIVSPQSVDSPWSASAWGASRPDDTTVIVGSGHAQAADSGETVRRDWSPGVQVLVAGESWSRCAGLGEGFPGVRAVAPGIAAALARGATTIALATLASNPAARVARRSGGVFLPTDVPSLVPVWSPIDAMFPQSRDPHAGPPGMLDVSCVAPVDAATALAAAKAADAAAAASAAAAEAAAATAAAAQAAAATAAAAVAATIAASAPAAAVKPVVAPAIDETSSTSAVAPRRRASAPAVDGRLCAMPPLRSASSSDVLESPRMGPDAGLPGAAGRHFLTASRVDQPSEFTLCSVPVVAAVQWGLCQGPPLSPGDVDPAPWLSSPLDDQATPLALPTGEAPPAFFTTAAGDVVRTSYGGAAAHASLVWALLPAVEPSLGHGVSILLHATLALFGHAAVVLPPGRLCVGASSEERTSGILGASLRSATRVPANVNGTSAAIRMLQSLHAELSLRGRETRVAPPENATSESPATWPTVDELLLAALDSADRSAVTLSLRDALAVRTWITALQYMGFSFPAVPPSPSAYVTAAARELLQPRTRHETDGFFGDPLPARPIADSVSGAVDQKTAESAMNAARMTFINASVEVFRVWDSSMRIDGHAVWSPAPRGPFSSSNINTVREVDYALPSHSRGCCGSYLAPLPVLPHTVPYLRHCFYDGSHMRDVVLVITHNNYFVPDSVSATALLLTLYASMYPVVFHAAQAPAIPEWGRLQCRLGGMHSGFIAHHCTAAALQAAHGHLGYLITNDDSIVQPWNLVTEPADRIWVFGPPKAPTLFPPGKTYASWSAHPRVGVAAAANASRHYLPRDFAMLARSGGTPTGTTCQLVDTFFIPGALAADASRLFVLHTDSETMVEIAIPTALAAMSPISEWHQLQTLYLWNGARPAAIARWHLAWDAFHPLKLSDPLLQYFLWEEWGRAARAQLLWRPPPAPGQAVGPDGASLRPAGKSKEMTEAFVVPIWWRHARRRRVL